jgi:hypothetical protein
MAVGALTGATVVWSLTRTKRRVAGASGPKRYQRPGNQIRNRPSEAKAGVKTVVIWGVAAALIAWVALSLASPAPSPNVQPQAAPGQPAAGPPAPQTTPLVSSSLTPPPPPGQAVPDAPPAGPAPGVQTPAAPFPAPVDGQSSIRNSALSISNPASSQGPPLSTFAPAEQELTARTDGSIGQGALAMAPSVSRMEPVGRSLKPDVEKVSKILAEAPEREKLKPPPKTEPRTPPLVNPNASGPVSYTVLLGSFGKPEYAERLRLKMVEAGLPVSVIEATSPDGKVWYRVMSGTFESQGEADNYSRELKQKNLVEKTFIFKSGK